MCEVEVQRWREMASGVEGTTFELRGELGAGLVSVGLAELSAYYSNRMSYAEVAGLVERVSGARLLSDTTIQELVVAKAVAVSECWREGLPEEETGIRTGEAVDWYEKETPEVLVLTDGIQVKRQKAERGKPEPAAAQTVRVNTDVWLVQQPQGGFRALVDGIGLAGSTTVPATAQVRHYLAASYGDRAEPLPVVAITDGAAAIRVDLETVFGHPVPVLLDWYHLEKRMWETMSLVARTKAEKELHLTTVTTALWRGQTETALTYLRTAVTAKNPDRLQSLITYLEKHRHEIPDYERRQQAGKPIGSGRMEKAVDQVVGFRQKNKGMSWSPIGSKALAILKVVELNGEWSQLWCSQAIPAGH